MKLYIIRHGETKLNALGRLQGWTDEPLNQNGKDLAIITGEALKEIPFDLVITSPLKRARETGELTIAASEKNFGRKIPIIEDRRIMEFNWGCWEGLGCLENNFEVPDPNYNIFYTDAFHYQGSPDGFWQEHVPYNCAVTIIDVQNGQAKITAKDKIYYDESLCFDHYKVIDK